VNAFGIIDKLFGLVVLWLLFVAVVRQYLHPKPKARPKVRHMWPSPQLPTAFEFGYDPYNTVHAHLIAMKHRLAALNATIDASVHNLPREVVLEPLNEATMAALRKNPWPKGLPPRQPWNASRYNKT
jgi:hypothetical protein